MAPIRQIACCLFAFVATLGVGLSAAPAQQGTTGLLSPVPLGVRGSFEPNLPPATRPAAVPLPPSRPAKASRGAGATVAPALKITDWSKSHSGQTAGVAFAAPEPTALDLSPRVDFGGVSLGLETGRGKDSTSSGNLLSPEARSPIPVDPTLAPLRERAKVPYLGLSISTPTN